MRTKVRTDRSGMAKKPRKAPDGASSEQLAKLFDCSTRQIELLAKEGIVEKLGRGRYHPERSTRNYIRHLREQAAARVGQDKTADAVKANVDLRTEQAALTRTRREMLLGETVKAADVREVWSRLAHSFRTWAQGLPGAIAFRVPTLNKADRKQIDQIIRDGLEDLALGRGYRVKGAKGDDDAAG